MIWISIYSPIVPVGNQVVLPGRLLHPLLTPRTLVRSVTVPYMNDGGGGVVDRGGVDITLRRTFCGFKWG